MKPVFVLPHCMLVVVLAGALLGLGPRSVLACFVATEIADYLAGGEGGPYLAGPGGVAVGPRGNVYVVGRWSNNVLRITPWGEVTEIVETSEDGQGWLEHPLGIAVDRVGNVYVSGEGSHNVIQITPEGAISTVIRFGFGDGRDRNLLSPAGVAVDGAGNVYVAGGLSWNVFRVTPDGEITEIINDSHGLAEPYGVAVDDARNVYVTGRRSDNAFRIAPEGDVTEIIDASGDGQGNSLDTAYGVAVDGAGTVYVGSVHTDKVFRVSPGGSVVMIMDSTGDGQGHVLDGAGNLATDAAGNVYVTGIGSDNAFRISPDGAITMIIGPDGDGRGNALDNVWNLAADGNHVYVAGLSTHNVFRIAPCPSGDFFCYGAHRRSFGRTEVSLRDRLREVPSARVRRAARLCNPADKNGEDPAAPGKLEHLVGYRVQQRERVRVEEVTVTNQFGEVTVGLAVRPDLLLVPSAKDRTQPVVPLVEPETEHFRCYPVRRARRRVSPITVRDQFGEFAMEVTRPRRLCTPVSTDGERVLALDTHLMCYTVRAPRGIRPPKSVGIANRFGADQVRPSRPRELCVASTMHERPASP